MAPEDKKQRITENGRERGEKVASPPLRFDLSLGKPAPPPPHPPTRSPSGSRPPHPTRRDAVGVQTASLTIYGHANHSFAWLLPRRI